MLNTSECLSLIENGVLGKGDADIAGTGVIVAFVLSACITLAAVLVAYVSGLVDDGLLRPVDKLVMRVPSRAGKHTKWHLTLRKAIMTMSDQQIVTGIAILGAGFQRLKAGQITVYHFQIVTYLAWMSSSVHLSALTLLRPYLIHHRGVLVWRLIGMLVLLAMLLIALVPTVSNDWAVITVHDEPNDWVPPPATAFQVPALCFWGQTYGDGVNPDAIISFLVLFVSYVWKMGGLFMSVRQRFDSCVRNPIDTLLEWPLAKLAKRYQAKRRAYYLWAFRFYLAVYLAFTAFLEVLASFTAALWLSTLGLIYGMMQIFIPRGLVQWSDPSIAQQESELGFGQLVPLILLVQPLGACSEHLWLVGKDDEEAYEDKEQGFRKSAQQWFQDSLRIAKTSNESLIDIMARYSNPSRTKQTPQRMHLKALLYTSRLFNLVVWGVQLAVTGTSVFIFYLDSLTIGWIRSDNWYFISLAVAIYFCSCLVLVLPISPFSRLGRLRKRTSLAHGDELETLENLSRDDRP